MQDTNVSFEYIPISHMNAYAYCPRRFYYEFALGEMIVNEHVLEGQQLHERVDTTGSRTRDEKLQMRRLYVCAPRLRLVGYCDLLEIENAAIGDDLLAAARDGKIYPVEYKKGKMGKWVSDHTQLCAQALALEEVLQLEAESIRHGYVFYISSARRDEVAIDETLRATTLNALAEARRVAAMNIPPPPITNWRKCRDCSLEPLCLPRETIAIQTQTTGEQHGNSLPD
jgi:CRISPR-associated exonuclease Cas4